jgi:hypothetical protein
MARAVKPEKILESLKKLYEKRAILDKQILETEKSFVAVSAQPGSAAPAKSAGRPKRKAPAPRKPSVKKNKES